MAQETGSGNRSILDEASILGSGDQKFLSTNQNQGQMGADIKMYHPGGVNVEFHYGY